MYPSFSLNEVKSMTVRDRTNWINRALARQANLSRRSRGS